MAAVVAKAYPSPSVVLLAFDWEPPSEERAQFLGFAIRRMPGFLLPSADQPSAADWLLNRLTFAGVARDPDAPSSVAPIQKFMWWDARFHFPEDQGRTFRYQIFPVLGPPGQLRRQEAEVGTVEVTIPHNVEAGIGTWFNRAVISSQAFSRQVSRMGAASDGGPRLTADQALEMRRWLANGLETVVPEFVREPGQIEGAVYHLTDQLWVIPAMEARPAGSTELVYDGTKAGAEANAGAVQALQGKARLFPRTKANIMHDKLLVRSEGSQASRVLTGSANFTTEGLTSQANLLHTWDSPELAGLFRARIRALQADPPLSSLAGEARWSDPVQVGSARVQVIFSPEATHARASIDAIVAAIQGAVARGRGSVLFCLFSPTDDALREACFEAGDKGLTMFGLVNRISTPSAAQVATSNPNASQLAEVQLYHRSRQQLDVMGAEYLKASNAPKGFVQEMQLFPGEKRPRFPPVIVHHKFVVVDGETDDPVVFTGSANMSNNSLHQNDENLLQIRGAPAVARIYLAEFFRLYEHYRFRTLAGADPSSPNPDMKLASAGDWAAPYFQEGTPEYKTRVGMARSGG